MEAKQETLYDEDIEAVADAIGTLVNDLKLTRVDIKLTNSEALVYWAGTVLRVDIKGLR